MKKIWMILTALFLVSLPLQAFAEGPLGFPMREGSIASAHEHNQEGIMHYNKGHYEEALKHFEMSVKIDSNVGESHFNMALCLDKIGKHGDATAHFKSARKLAQGNVKITDSQILNDHIGM